MIGAGIDIGTSFSSVAVVKNGVATPVRVKTGDSLFGDSYSMPTVVFVERDGSVKLGQAAFNKKKSAPEFFKQDFKREFGTKTPYLLGSEEFLPEDFYQKIFIHFKKQVEDSVGEKMGRVFITHPAGYSEEKKKLLTRTAAVAGFFDIALIDEPTAAAVAYSQKDGVANGEILLVYDFGGGTFDVSLIKKTDRGFIHLTESIGLPECGGIDFDRIIARDLLKSLQEQGANTQKELQNPRFAIMIPEICAKIKHQLSFENVVEESIEVGMEYYEYCLTKERFEEMVSPLVNRTMEKVSSLLSNANISKEYVNRVILVGGTTHIPLVRQSIMKMFGNRTYINTDIDPALAVAIGAAVISWDEWVSAQMRAQEAIRAREEAARRAREEEDRRIREQEAIRAREQQAIWAREQEAIRARQEEEKRSIDAQRMQHQVVNYDNSNAVLEKRRCRISTIKGRLKGEVSTLAVYGELCIYKDRLEFEVDTASHPLYSKSKSVRLDYSSFVQCKLSRGHKSITAGETMSMIIPGVNLISMASYAKKNGIFTQASIYIKTRRDEVYILMFDKEYESKSVFQIITTYLPKDVKLK